MTVRHVREIKKHNLFYFVESILIGAIRFGDSLRTLYGLSGQ